jgi:murein DD-endopeptidase MepM/ murein hydrolase activator NlpD
LLKTRLASARIHSLRAPSVIQLALIAVLGFGAGAFGHYTPHGQLAAPQNGLSAAVASVMPQVLQSTGADMAAALAATPASVTREAEIEEGATFADMLADQGVSNADAAAAMNALAKAYNLRKLRAGQDVTLSFLRTGAYEAFQGATFQPEDTREISVARASNGFTVTTRTIPITHRRLAASVEIHSTLYEAGDRAHVPHALMASLIHIYSHDVDFQRDVHPGDRLEMLYDQPMTAKGKAVGEGVIIYASLNSNGKEHPIYRVTFSDGDSDYFDADGHSTRRALLRTPVAAARITSGFGMRIHPLLGYSMMHKGVDFGAPMGAPIYAAGNGIIEDIGWHNGYGRYIRIRHSATLGTAYAHMSRFNPNLYRGSRVTQGEVIGYVGMSGRATGPHLHFELLVNGKQVNPALISKMPSGRTLSGKLLDAFKDGQGRIRQEYTNLMAAEAAQRQQPQAPQVGLIPASASGPAFPTRPMASCGLRGGC